MMGRGQDEWEPEEVGDRAALEERGQHGWGLYDSAAATRGLEQVSGEAQGRVCAQRVA